MVSSAFELEWRPGAPEVQATLAALCDHSAYARQEEICQGFVTVRGGHRVIGYDRDPAVRINPGIIGEIANPPADRILAGPDSFRQRLVDHRHVAHPGVTYALPMLVVLAGCGMVGAVSVARYTSRSDDLEAGDRDDPGTGGLR